MNLHAECCRNMSEKQRVAAFDSVRAKAGNCFFPGLNRLLTDATAVTFL